MKNKLTVTVERSLVEFGKQYAARRGTSLSGLIEEALRRLSREAAPSFSTTWRGRFSRRERHDDERTRYLDRRFG